MMIMKYDDDDDEQDCGFDDDDGDFIDNLEMMIM